MEHDMRFNQELLDLFSKMIDDKTEKLILQVLFSNKNTEEMLDEIIKALEYRKND